MLADGRTVPQAEVVKTGICIVGAGPAGITLSEQLGLAGFDVLLVERGDRHPKVPHTVPDTAASIGIPYPLGESRAFELGGSVHKWRVSTPLGDGFGRLREMDPEDFERRPWIPNSGWPFDKSHLQPFYQRAESLFDWLEPADQRDDVWDLDFDASSRDVGVRTRVFVFADPSLFPGEMCRRLEGSDNVLVLTNSVAVDIECDESPSRVSALTVKTSSEHGFSVKAQAYVLATGGIENPRLLLASRGRHPNGLGNGHDLVGRFFMEHPHFRSGHLVTQEPAAFGERYSEGIRLHNGVPIQKEYSLPEELIKREQLNRIVFRFDAVPGVDSGLAVGDSLRAFRSVEAARYLYQSVRKRSLPSSGTLRLTKTAVFGVHHIVRHALNRLVAHRGRRLGEGLEQSSFRIRAMAEQAPNPMSRVSLADRRDVLGVPVANLNWQLSEQDLRSIRRSQELFGRSVASSGRHYVESLVGRRGLPLGFSVGYHHMGTTRMHDSPASGVVDRDCRVHGVENLYVAGSSVFPTGGYVNPTLTILALAFRLADHLRASLRSWD